MKELYFGHRISGRDGEARWDDIYSSRRQVEMCGDSKIYSLHIIISPDQERQKSSSPDYWGWVDTDDNFISLIQSFFGALQICFAHGIDGAEKEGEGKAYRLIITEVEES